MVTSTPSQCQTGLLRHTTLFAALCVAGLAHAAPGDTELVSENLSGQAAGIRSAGTVSGDGRYVSFDSSAGNLVAGDTGNGTDVFVRDRQSGTIERVSVSSSGAQGNNGGFDSSITPDGRYVVFLSNSTNLVSGDTNNQTDVFVRDRQSNITERVSVDSSGIEANDFSQPTAISADGRYVAFCSNATNLVPNDTNQAKDVFVHDRQTGVTERVSVSSSGAQANAFSVRVALSADGRYVAFESRASNLVPNLPEQIDRMFVRDRQAGTTEIVSLDGSGNPLSGGTFFPAINADGRYVAFTMTSGSTSVLVKDRQTGALLTAGSAIQGNGYPSISADGRFVAFWSAGPLVASDTNGVVDVYVRDLATGQVQLASVNSSGVVANATNVNQDNANPSISADGRFVSFSSTATNLSPNDASTEPDAYIHELAPAATVFFTLAPQSIDFGRAVRNTTSPTRSVEVKNTSGSTLPIVSVALAGANPGQFALTSHCGSSLAAGATCLVDVVFKPTTYQVRTASLVVTMGSGAGSKSVSLRAQGIPVSYTLFPASYDFGGQTVNSVSTRQFITLTNNSGAPMPVYGIAIGGANAGQFGFNTTCGKIVATSCTIGVVFKPTSVGAKTAVITVLTGSTPNKTISLRGTGN